MGNKYGSNIRTYTARNLVWNVSASQPVPFIMAAPSPLTVQGIGMVPVFYKAQFPLETDWNRESKIAVRRAGIFCNFADGLVQKMNTSRVIMQIRVLITEPVIKTGASTVSFVKGSNEITGPNLDNFINEDIIYDSLNGNPYFMYKHATAPGLPAYLTDYARVTQIDPNVIRLNIKEQQDFTIYNIATLNTMYESELFFPFCPTLITDRMLIACSLGIDGNDTSLDFFTKTVDPAFNGSAISFDSVIELEITPV